MDDNFIKMILGSALRHGATIAGGWLLREGIIDNDGATQFVAAVMMFGGIGWSLWQKYGHARLMAILAKAGLGVLAFALICNVFVASAFASDVNAPANKALTYQYPTTKCGLYYGVNSIGSTGSVANAAVGTQQVTGAIGVDVGYTCPAGLGFWFVDGAFDFTNVNGSTNGLSLSGPAMFEQRFGFGAPVDMIISAIPGLQSLQSAMPSLIPLPQGVSVNTSSPYVFASVSEQDVSATLGFAQNRQWLVSPGLGIGNKVRLSNGVVFDPFAEYVLNSNAMCFGPLSGSNCVKLSTQIRAGFHLDF